MYTSNLHLVDFVCLYGVFRPTQEFFSLVLRPTIPGEGSQILTSTRHAWSLSSEGSLARYTYHDTGQPFIMVVTFTPIAERLAVKLSLPILTSSVAAAIKTPNLAHMSRTL